MNRRIRLILITILIISGISLAAETWAHKFKYDIIELTLISRQGRFKIKAEIADSWTKRILGLMHRKHLASDAGMLFIFEDEAPRSFWMKNTLIPLDMIFVADDLKIVHIAKMATPCKIDPCPRYNSGYPAKYVVEINGGLSGKMGLAAGDLIEFELSTLTSH